MFTSTEYRVVHIAALRGVWRHEESFPFDKDRIVEWVKAAAMQGLTIRVEVR